jgi:hypothetical protein
MSNATPKVRMVAASAALFLLTVSGGCKGFFVNQPDSIAVTQNGTSTLSVAVGTPVQLTATATYNSGSKDVTKSATWSSSTACATVGTNTGVVTAVGPSSGVTITATLAGVQGTITGSTTGGTSQTLSISPTLVSLSSGTAQFQALDSNQVDQAASATWTSSDTSILSFASSTGGLATLSATGSVTVTASLTSGNTCASGSASVTVQ